MVPAASDDSQDDMREPASTEDKAQPSPDTPAQAAEAESVSDVMAEPDATALASAAASAGDTMGNGTLPAPVEDGDATGSKSAAEGQTEAAEGQVEAAVTPNPSPEPEADVQEVSSVQVNDTPKPIRAASESEAVTESAALVAESLSEDES